MTSDETLERSTLLKASWRLLPLIGVAYCVAYMDRVNIGFAAATMNRDLNFSATAYGLGGGLFFLSYALLEVPSNLLLVRFGARRWLARIMFTWGLLAMGMLFVRTPMQFYVMRFLLGAAEAGFFPGVIYYISIWFPAQHRGRAISRFYIALPLSSVLMGAIAGTLLGLNGRLGLAGWQWLFLIEGMPAIVLSIVFITFLPDGPAKAPWLTDPEKDWLSRRLASDAALLSEPVDHSLRRAITNPVVLGFGLVNFLHLGAMYALTLSAPMYLDQTTHLGPARVGYLIAAAGLLGAVSMMFNGWHSDHSRERYFHLAGAIALTACGYAVIWASVTPLVTIVGYLLCITSYHAVGGVLWLAPSERLHPRSAAAGVAAINSIGMMGSFIAPFAWGLAKDRTGSFHAALSCLPVLALIGAAVVLSLRPRKSALKAAAA
jgi:ACS family tartrate transporter-like MFS transporter